MELLLILQLPLCFFPGLEARLGFANENGWRTTDDHQQFNGWLAWNPGALNSCY